MRYGERHGFAPKKFIHKRNKNRTKSSLAPARIWALAIGSRETATKHHDYRGLIVATNDGVRLSAQPCAARREGAMEGIVKRVFVFSDDNNAKDEIERICDLSGAEFEQ